MPYPYYPNYLNTQTYLPQPTQQPIMSVPTPTPTPQAPSSSIVWVQGEAGAKSYLVGAGQSVLLMDSETSAFYIKSTDASGMPLPLRVFDYTERVQTQAPVPSVSHEFDPEKYVTREEFEELKKEMKHDGE